MKFDPGQPSRSRPTCSCFTSSSLDNPIEAPTPASWRGTKGGKSKETTNGKPGVTGRREKLRKILLNLRPPTLVGLSWTNDSNSAVGDLGPVCMGLALHLTGRVFGLAVGGTDSRNIEPRCVSAPASALTFSIGKFMLRRLPNAGISLNLKRSSTMAPKRNRDTENNARTPTAEQEFPNTDIH